MSVVKSCLKSIPLWVTLNVTLTLKPTFLSVSVLHITADAVIFKIVCFKNTKMSSSYSNVDMSHCSTMHTVHSIKVLICEYGEKAILSNYILFFSLSTQINICKKKVYFSQETYFQLNEEGEVGENKLNYMYRNQKK